MAENVKEKTVRYLNDAYAAVAGGAEEIQQVAGDAFDPDVKAVLNDQATQARIHADLLNARIQALGGDKSEAKAGFNTLLGKASHLSNAFHDKSDKQTQDVIKLLALAHFRAGAYSSLNAYAKAVGDSDTAEMAATLMQEDIKEAGQLLQLIPRLSISAVSQTSA